MLSGKKFECDELEMRVSAETVEYSRSNDTPDLFYGGSIRSMWTPSQVQNLIGILLEAKAIKAGIGLGADRREYRLNIPELSFNELRVRSGFAETINTHIIIYGLKIYATQYAFVTQWDSLEWYVEGDLEATLGGVNFGSNRFTQSGIYILGQLGYVAPIAGINPFPVYGEIIRSSAGFTAEMKAKQTKGWRFKKGGEWHELPVDLIYGSVPGTHEACSFDFALASVDANTTYDFNAYAHSIVVSTSSDGGLHTCPICPDGSEANPPPTYQLTNHYNKGIITSGSVLLLPNLDKTMHLIGGDDFGCLVYRGGLPKTFRTGFNSCCEYDVVNCEIDGDPLLGCGNFASSSIEVNPRFLNKIEFVRDNERGLLEPLTLPTYAPYIVDGLGFESNGVSAVIVDPGACPPVDPPASPIFEENTCACWDDFEYFNDRQKSHGYPSVQVPVNIGAFQYYRHEDGVAMYIDYWANPLFSYFAWFPPNRDLQNWKVYGAKVDSNDYWLLLKQQYADAAGYAPSLFPPSHKTKQRLNLISEPLMFSGLSSMVNFLFMGVNTSWFGINGFDIDNPLFQSFNVNINSQNRFTPQNCTLNFTSDRIEVSSGGGTCEVSFRLLDWSIPPYIAPAVCSSLTVNWDNDNVDVINVYAESISGFRVLIASTPGTYQFPKQLDTHYAGSYGQSFILTSGADIAPNGLSSLIYSSAELALAHSLIRGGGMYKLVFEITPVNPANLVKLHYPIFLQPDDGEVVVVPETSKTNTLLYPDGQGIRFGQLKFWDEQSETFLDIPVFRDMSSPMTVLDYLCYKRLLYRGVSATDGLDAEIQTIYDSSEGDTRAHLSKHTHAFPFSYFVVEETPLSGKYALVNSFRECPALTFFPNNKRNNDLSFIPDEFSNEQFAFCLIPRRYISAVEYAHLFDEADTQKTVISSFAVPSSWRLSEHSLAVTNNELNWKIKSDGEEFGSFVPWHDCFNVLSPPDVIEGDEPRVDCNDDRRHVLVFLRQVESEKFLSIGYSSSKVPQTWSYTETDLEVKKHAIAWNRRLGGAEYLYIDVDDKVKYLTIKEGELSMPMLINEIGDNVAIEVNRDGVKFLYWSEGTALKVAIYDAENNLIESDTVNIAIDEGTTFDVSEFVSAKGEWRMQLIYIAWGKVFTASSVDGINFA